MIFTEKHNMEDWIGKRKYRSQMSKREIDGLFDRLKTIEKWRIAGHALDRLEEKGIKADYQDIVSTIHNANMVEYKIDRNRITGKPEERVVIASKSVVNRCYNLKAVYSLTERRIVTVWINHVRDNHATLDWGLYDKTMPVFGI
ncbi:MAG: hypothetical protein ABS939_08370 [Psychrobacillus sp.]